MQIFYLDPDFLFLVRSISSADDVIHIKHISAGGGVESIPLDVALAIALNINRSTSNFLTFKFHYQEII